MPSESEGGPGTDVGLGGGAAASATSLHSTPGTAVVGPVGDRTVSKAAKFGQRRNMLAAIRRCYRAMKGIMIRKLPLALALTLVAAPAFAAEDPTSPTVTAPASPSVAEQIDAYLRDSPVSQLPAETAPLGATSSAAPRQPHGVVSVGVGTHGYRSIYMRSDLPVGDTGTVSVAIGDTRFNGGFGGWSPYGPGMGFDGERCGVRPVGVAPIAPRWPTTPASCEAGR